MKASIKWTKAALEKLAAHVQGAKSGHYETTYPQTAGLKLQVDTPVVSSSGSAIPTVTKNSRYALASSALSVSSRRVQQRSSTAPCSISAATRKVLASSKNMPLVREFADECIEHAKLTKITYKNDIAKFRDHVLTVIGNLRLSEVSPAISSCSWAA